VYAPVNIQYAIDRFAMETKRQLDVLDKHLADKEFMVGDEYSIADMAIFPWILALSRFYKADEFLALPSYTHVARWCQALLARPAVQRGLRVNSFGDDAVPERHSPDDFLPK
jgi:GST-like protein